LNNRWGSCFKSLILVEEGNFVAKKIIPREPITINEYPKLFRMFSKKGINSIFFIIFIPHKEKNAPTHNIKIKGRVYPGKPFHLEFRYKDKTRNYDVQETSPISWSRIFG
jgi:hypothetical protein